MGSRACAHVKVLLAALVVTVGVLVVASPAAHAAPPNVPNAAWQPIGAVNVVEPSPDGKYLYVGGQFDYLGPLTGSSVRVDAEANVSGMDWPTFKGGSVRDIISDGQGGWFVGGSFTTADSASTRYLAHVLPWGAVDPDWNHSGVFTGGSGVNDLELSEDGTKLYVGGLFSDIGGDNNGATNLAKFDVTSGFVDRAFTGAAGFNNSVNAMEERNGYLYVGGEFSAYRGVTGRTRLIRLDAASGVADPGWLPAPNGVVNDMSLFGNELYVVGGFTNVGGAGAGYGAGFDVSGANPSPLAWNPAANAPIHAIDVDATYMALAGEFTVIGGAGRMHVAVLPRGGVTPLSGNPGSSVDWSGAVSALAVAVDVTTSGTVRVGGSFDRVGAAPSKGAFEIVASTGALTSWRPRIGGTVHVFADDGANVLTGGAYNSAGGVMRDSIAKIDLATGRPTTWNPQVLDGSGNNEEILAIAATPNAIVVGGREFLPVWSTSSPLMSLDPTTGDKITSTPPPALSGATRVVNDLEYNGSYVYVAGEFATGISNLMRFTATSGVIDTGWNPAVNGPVNDIDFDLTNVYLAGSFTQVGAAIGSASAASVLISNGAISGWDPTLAGGTANAVSVEGTDVYVGGTFTSPGNGFARTFPDGTINGSAMPAPGSVVHAIDAASDGTYLAGTFSVLNGSPRARFGSLDPGAGASTPTAWNPNSPSFAIWSEARDIARSGAYVFVGGANGLGIYETVTDSRAPVASIQGADEAVPGVSPSDATYWADGAKTMYVRSNGPVVHPSFTVKARAHDTYASTTNTYAEVSGLETVTWPTITGLGQWSGGGAVAGAPRGLNLTCFDDATFVAGPGATQGSVSAIDRSINYDGSAGKRPDQLPTLPATLMSSLHAYDDAADGNVSYELFACRWKGFLVAPSASGTYRFHAAADDAVRVNVGGADGTWPTINEFPAGPLNWSATMPFAPNQAQPITTEWMENSNGASIQLKWDGTSTPNWTEQPITEAAFVTRVDYSRTYTLNTAGGGVSGTFNVIAKDRANFTASAPFNVSVDNTPPSAGSLTMSPLFGWSTTPVIALNVPASSDADSGVFSRVLERRSTALLANGACSPTAGDLANWTPLGTWNSAGGPHNDTVGNGCYQYRFVVTDNVGNVTTIEPAGQSLLTNWHKVDLTAPAGGAMTYAATSVNVLSAVPSWNAPTDAQSGIQAGTSLFRSSAPLSNDACSTTWGAGSLVGSSDPVSPYVDNGLTPGFCYRYYLLFTNGAGTSTSSAPGPVIKIDNAPPTATVNAPAGALSGTASIGVNVTDAATNLTSASLDFTGPTSGNLCSSGVASDWIASCPWNTSGLDGTYSLVLTGRDRANNTVTTTLPNVLVDNSAPVVSNFRLQEGFNPASQYIRTTGTIPELFFNAATGSSGSFTVLLDAADAGAGVDRVDFSSLGPGWLTTPGGADTVGPDYQWTYGWTGTAASGTGSAQAWDLSAHFAPAKLFRVTADSAAPTGGAIDYPNGVATIAMLTVTPGSDAGSGIATTRVLRRSQPLDATQSCPAAISTTPWSATGMPTWSDPAPLAAATTWQDTTVQRGFCYQYAIELADNVGWITRQTTPKTYIADVVGLVVTNGPAATPGVAEGAAVGVTYNVSLRSAPTAPVVVSYVGDGQVSPAAAQLLTFDQFNWSTPQPVTITAIDDEVDEPTPHAGSVTFSMSSAMPGGDAGYNGLTPVTRPLTVVDNDKAGIRLVIPNAGLAVAEPATSTTYGVRLESQPHGNVTVTLGTGTQARAASTAPTATPDTLTFTPTNWNVVQTVKVQAVDDPDIEGSHTTAITHTPGATHADDEEYATLPGASATVTITDDDVAGFQLDGPINPTLSEADPTVVATVRTWLTARPASDVTVTWGTSGGQLTPSAVLTFTPANWNQVQVATIHATNDTIAEAPLHQVIGEATVTSGDPNFAAVQAKSGPVTIRDDDVAAFVTSPGQGWTVNDDGQVLLDESATSGSVLRIRTVGDPTSDITITPEASPAEQLVISPASHTIPAGSHEQVVTFSVRAVNDREKELDPHPAKITWKVSTSDVMYGASAIPVTVARIKDGETTTTRDNTPDPKPDPTPTPDPDPDPTPTPTPTPGTTGDGGHHTDDTTTKPGGDATDDDDAPGETVADDGSVGDESITSGGSKDTKRSSSASTKTKNPAKRLKDWAGEHKGKASVAASAAGTAALWGAKPLALAGKALMSGGGGVPGHPPGMGQVRHLFRKKFRARLKRLWKKKRDLDRDDEDDWDDFLWGDRAA